MNSLLKYFGIVYIFVLIAIVGLGMNYLNDIVDYAHVKMIGPVVTIPRDSVQPPTNDLPEVKGIISPPVDVMKLSAPTPELVEKGKTIFQTTCASCHGTEGKGDGIASATLNPKPRNFTSLDGWKNGPKLTQMYKTIQEGLPNSAMASFANIPPEDRIAVIHYIHETFTKSYPKNTDEELKELDKTYSLSAGVKQPNQISIKAAMEKLVKENDSVTQKVKRISDLIEKNTTDTAAILFKKVTNNSVKVLTMLATDSKWISDENQIYNIIGSNPSSNGFRGEAAVLNQKEIQALYQYFKNLFINYKG